MVDPVVGLAAKAVSTEIAKAAPGLVGRVLGPAADEVGAALGRYTNRQLANVGRVADAAGRKGPKDRSGFVGPRAAAKIIEDSAYADNEIVAEYLSGVLASSRSEDGSDDRAVAWSALVGRLSSPALRLHFILYSTTRAALLGKKITIRELCEKRLFLPFSAFIGVEGGLSFEQFVEGVYELDREQLVTGWAFGDPKSLIEMTGLEKNFPDEGVAFSVSRAGLGLWLWGLGFGGYVLVSVVDPEVDLEPAISNVPPFDNRSVDLQDLPDVQPEASQEGITSPG